MVTDRLADGVRIAELLASEVTGNESDLRGLTVVDADRDVEPTADGALAYRIARERAETDDGATEALAEVSVQPDRALIEAVVAPDAAADAAREVDLRVRPKAVHPPRTLVFVEDGAQVKRALAVLEALRDASRGE
ncbi:hypothetical protein C465_01049 [Halorubrum distributum JCM 9100]|uniref:DUF7993 domain-containing protein n=5 Tax=Halorubrum distributum TaxID=29283 RepID=M0F1Z0_9EURY|nr:MULTISPECIES: hypothetical protein [Halorubrum distributum group]ELZ33045.1 hypothetical protein C473_07614 [Halorubrum terrestre JCM 10247]ELZ53945.1 hypothetical protein C465_01049 [Halorubrum distributum JCM 9100]ELZ56369.1 hypothetical protein C466_03787 [Halorubrum distributum JCM 10118]EMA68439.1 hypothetical protein C462_14263 [Halorubrum arcis JCM 13916]MYL15508.1 hypothetical protein [Halorubrum terrestre]